MVHEWYIVDPGDDTAYDRCDTLLDALALVATVSRFHEMLTVRRETLDSSTRVFTVVCHEDKG